MSARAHVGDGFWLCLRPSLNLLSRPRPQLPSILNNGTARTKRASSSCVRRTSNRFTNRRGNDAPNNIRPIHTKPEDDTVFDSTLNDRSQMDTTPTDNAKLDDAQTIRRRVREEGYWSKRMLLQENRAPTSLMNVNIRGLYRLLDKVAHGKKPNQQGILRIVKELIEYRHQQPKPYHYKIMILANTHCSGGAAIQVEKLLEEMKEYEIVLDSSTLHAALKVLAIHPDYILRQEILHMLRDRWLPLMPEGWHHVVVGLIRERQYEMAIDQLERMELQNIPIEDWLVGLLIYNLSDAGEFDEVLRLLRTRTEAGHKHSSSIWFHVLDGASLALHEELTSYIWKQQVELGYINPPYGVCNNVLMTCSRSGNAQLATSVFKVLSTRKAAFKQNQYEALIDTCLVGNDIDAAIRILCMMNKTSIGAPQSSTRTILSHWIKTGTAPQDAWATLKRLRDEEKLEIPFAAANLVIELCASLAEADTGMDIYREFHTVCSTGAETATFNLLIDTCRMAKRYDLATFLVQEMILLKSLPNRKTYECLILFCVDTGHFKEGYDYLIEMAVSGFALQKAAKEYIVAQTAGVHDKHAKYLRFNTAVQKPTPRVPKSNWSF